MKLIKFILLSLAFRSSNALAKYPISDHFDGSLFFNPNLESTKNFWDFLKWQATSTKTPWPNPVPERTAGETTEAQPPVHGSFIQFVNHSTFLLQLGSQTLLTDPIFSERASPVSFAGPKRVHPPGVALENLPKIDIIMISHNHYDHMDEASIRKLAERDNPLFVVPLGNAEIIKSFGAQRITELDWWDSLDVGSLLNVTLVPAQHWSSRSFFDRNKSLWGGFVVKHQNTKIYFAGDTGFGDFFDTIHKRLGAMDVSLLPIGAYEPRWFMKDHHMDPNEAIRAHITLKSSRSIAAHFGTFQMADEGYMDPIRNLNEAMEQQGISNSAFLVPRPGQKFPTMINQISREPHAVGE